MTATQPSTTRRLLVLLGVLVLTPLAAAPAQAQIQVGTCPAPVASADLDVNNVRARLYNNGGLFWKGGNPVYEVPKDSGRQAIFASGVWLGGKVNNQLRFAGADYQDWEFWPGPIPDGTAPSVETCQTFDRFWKVSRTDISAYNQNGTVSADLGDWPVQWGAPYYVDANDNARRDADEPRIERSVGDAGYGAGGQGINLAGDERPDIIGDQGIWWVMNDLGNAHLWSNANPIGIEVRALAFSFNTADALNNTTFYRYQLFYKGTEPLEDAFLGLWSDPDLGQFNDDYVGSQPEIGLGYVYNGDTFDEGSGGYLDQPPALGYDYFQGPLVDADGEDNDGDGETDEPGERIAMEKFVYYNNDATVIGNPANGQEGYQYLNGQWRDGLPIEFGGNGRDGTTGVRTDWMFTATAVPGRNGGSPPAYWSEYNIDGLGTANTPADRRFVQSSGPFTIEPGDFQEIVFGIVWSQAPSGCGSQPQIASANQLFFDDITAQGAFNANFDIPPPPPSVVVEATPLDQAIVLNWAIDPSATVPDNDPDLFDILLYEVESPFADPGAGDQTYNFEGFNVYQYENDQDQEGILVATFDIRNNVTVVTDQALDCESGAIITDVVALGEDTGIRTSTAIFQDAFTQQPLRNNTTYFFGVQPYAYNEASSPNRIFAAPVTRVEVRPSLIDPRNDGTVLNAGVGDVLPVSFEGIGGGRVDVRVTNPVFLTGDSYRVEFYDDECFLNADDPSPTPPANDPEATVGTDGVDNDGDGEIDEEGETSPYACINYDITNVTTGEIVFNGREFTDRTGDPGTLGTDVFEVAGLTFDIQGPAPGPLFLSTGDPAFMEHIAPDGSDPCEASDVSLFGCDETGDNFVYPSFNSTGEYLTYFLGPEGSETVVGLYNPNDFEIRFTEEGSYGAYVFAQTAAGGGRNTVIRVPFEVWDVGIVSPGAENDPADDVQMIAALFADFELDADGNTIPNSEGVCEFNIDESVATVGGDEFPASDRIYAYYPIEGQSYAEWEAFAAPLVAGDPNQCPDLEGNQDTFGLYADFGRGRPIQRHVYLDATGTGDTSILDGSVMRFYTTDPIQAGDQYTINTADFFATTDDELTAAEALDLIAITPNPYRGRSEYETSNLQNIARFVNLPAQATIRIFTLSGTLVRTLEKPDNGATTVDWDLDTESGLPAASGMYLIHVEARDADGSVIGERVLKFGLIQRRVQLDVL